MTDYFLNTSTEMQKFLNSILYSNEQYVACALYAGAGVTNGLVTIHKVSGQWPTVKEVLYQNVSGTSAVTARTGYKLVDLGTGPNFYAFTFTTQAEYRYFRKNYDYTSLPKQYSDYTSEEHTAPISAYVRYVCVPDKAEYTASSITSRWQSAASGNTPGRLFPTADRPRERMQTYYLNDLMQHKQPFGPTSRRRRRL